MSTSHPAKAAIQSASTDGEATVYITNKFTRDFDIAYRAVLTPGAKNKSWTTLSMLLVGSRLPGPGATVGLATGDPKIRHPHPFVYVVYPGSMHSFHNFNTNCAAGCTIELRGDSRRIYACVDGVELASWSRSDLYLQQPYIQLNGEAHAAGDTLVASLSPIRTTVAGRSIKNPTCAFTTHGIEPRGLDTITFRGMTNDAGGAFLNLGTLNHGDKC
jgi:hypothetical protein